MSLWGPEGCRYPFHGFLPADPLCDECSSMYQAKEKVLQERHAVLEGASRHDPSRKRWSVSVGPANHSPTDANPWVQQRAKGESKAAQLAMRWDPLLKCTKSSII